YPVYGRNDPEKDDVDRRKRGSLERCDSLAQNRQSRSAVTRWRTFSQRCHCTLFQALIQTRLIRIKYDLDSKPHPPKRLGRARFQVYQVVLCDGMCSAAMSSQSRYITPNL